eukprot:COSAG01_NODE_29983_length_625_cov_3.235741_1_plen_33_part_10
MRQLRCTASSGRCAHNVHAVLRGQGTDDQQVWV